jgi:thiol-disulfide isomerase/thioredoxin
LEADVTGLLILALALVAALAFGLHRRVTDGRFGGKPVVEVRGAPATSRETTPWDQVSAALPDAEPGDRATLVQFSSAFCAPCRTTRVVLADIARSEAGVSHVEVDAEQHLELVRALDVRRTPTTLVLDADGRELVRAAGAPRKQQVLDVLPVRTTR